MPAPPSPAEPSDTPGDGEEQFTVDELAAQVGMTVRNVRAYASRGLLPPPRLAGRTGFYNREHVQRLQLVRELLDRGITLAAVETAIRDARPATAGHTLDLLHLLDTPHDVEPEIMSRDALAALAGVERDDELIHAMAEYDLVRYLDDEMVEVLQPQVVRIGTTAVALGLAPSTIIRLYPLMKSRLRAIADAFVAAVLEEIVGPFVAGGMPEDDWDRILTVIEELLPVSGQITVAILRAQLGEAIDSELTTQLGRVLPGSGSAD